MADPGDPTSLAHKSPSRKGEACLANDAAEWRDGLNDSGSGTGGEREAGWMMFWREAIAVVVAAAG